MSCWLAFQWGRVKKKKGKRKRINELHLIIGISDFCRVTEHLVRSILSVKGVSRGIASLKSVKEEQENLFVSDLNARD